MTCNICNLNETDNTSQICWECFRKDNWEAESYYRMVKDIPMDYEKTEEIRYVYKLT